MKSNFNRKKSLEYIFFNSYAHQDPKLIQERIRRLEMADKPMTRKERIKSSLINILFSVLVLILVIASQIFSMFLMSLVGLL